MTYDICATLIKVLQSRKRIVSRKRLEFSNMENWLVVSTHLKNISQMGNLPQIGVKIKNVSNHHLENVSKLKPRTNGLLILHICIINSSTSERQTLGS